MPLHVVTLNLMSSRWTRRILAGFPARRQAYTLNTQNASGDISIGRDIDSLANTSEMNQVYIIKDDWQILTWI